MGIQKAYSEEFLIEELNNKAIELNKTPTTRDMKNPSAMTYIIRFGSWNNAIKKAKLEPYTRSKTYKKALINTRKYTKEELLNILRNEFFKNNSSSMEVYEKNRSASIPCYRTMRRFFDCSWKDIVELTKFHPVSKIEMDIIKRKIIKVLKEWREES